MQKRSIIIAATAIVIALALAVFYILKPQKSVAPDNIYKYIPQSSPFFITINDPVDLLISIEENEMLQTFASSNLAPTFFKSSDSILAFIDKSESLKELFNNQKLILSLNYTGKNDINPLFLAPLNNKKYVEIAKNSIDGLKETADSPISIRKYNKVDIAELKFQGQTIFIAIHRDVLIFSTHSLLVEEVIRQLNETEISIDSELESLIKTTDQQADIHLFFNHEKGGQLANKIVANSLSARTNNIKTYGAWTELDLSIKSQEILLSGFTGAENNENFYTNVLKGQTPVDNRIDKVLPGTTAYYYLLGLSDIEKYFKDYQEFLEKRNLYFQWHDKLKSIENQVGVDFREFFQEYAEGTFCTAGVSVDRNNPSGNKIFVVGTKSGSSVMNELISLKSKYIQANKLQSSEWEKSYEIDAQTVFTIHRFPFPSLPKVLFGPQFSSTKAQWFAVYENYLIFADNYRDLAQTLHANTLGETLSSDLSFNKFKTKLNGKNNITFYANPAACLPIADLFFEEEIYNRINEDENLRKFKAFAYQVSAAKPMLYNNVCLYYNPEIQNKPQTVWQSHLSSEFEMKPKFVINHYDRFNKEIILQDKEDNLYLINNVGRILWQTKLDGQLLGEIHQIDIYKNGKLQYLMNTKNKLYLIDRNGNNVGKYPVNFRAEASNGVAVVDYDNSRDYRFFVACADQKIYAYETDGNLLTGWHPFRTDHPVTLPIQHIRIEGKDYIVASDKMKDYLLHRKGTIRVKTDEVYEHSPFNLLQLEERTSEHAPRLVTTDVEGSLHYTYFDGTHEVVRGLKLSKNHKIVVDNVNSDEHYEYLLADDKELKVLDHKLKPILKQKYDAPIKYAPNLYAFSNNNIKIGVTTIDNNIYLFDLNGSSHPGFPLRGSTEFSIGFISDERSNFNLLVGSSDAYLYNYYVE